MGRGGKEDRKGKGGGGGMEWEVGRERGRKENILNGSKVDIRMLVGRDVLSTHIETCPLSNEETE